MIAQQSALFLVSFPFSDYSSSKVRPVLILSKDSFNVGGEDVVVCAVTSNTQKAPHTVLIQQQDLEEGTLLVPSAIKVENMLKVDKKLLIKQIGVLHQNTFSTVLTTLQKLFA